MNFSRIFDSLKAGIQRGVLQTGLSDSGIDCDQSGELLVWIEGSIENLTGEGLEDEYIE